MNTPKNIFGTLAAAVLPVMLFSFGVLFSAYQILGSPAPLKQALDQSGLYDAAISEALKQATPAAADGKGAAIPVDDPGVQQAISKAIPPDFLQQNSETAIDGLYNWLQGRSSTLDFKLNLGDAKTTFADELATYTQEHVAALPVCTDPQDTTAVTNPLQATCKPAGLDAAAAGQTVRNELLNNQDFLPDAALTAQDLKNNEGQTLEQQLHAVPAVYEQVKWGMIVTGILAIVSAIAVLLLSGAVYRGLKRLAWITIPVGAVSALLAWGAGAGLTKLTDALVDNEGVSGLQAKIIDALNLLTQDVRNWWLGYGLTLAGTGILAAIIALALKRRGRVAPEPTAPRPTPLEATPLNPITDEEAKRATEVAPAPPSAPARPAGQKRPPRRIQ